MTYKINGTEITLQPTTGRWLPNPTVGVTGDGHSIYPAVREFELRWGLMSPAEINQLFGFYDSVQITGTCVVELPEFGGATYTFVPYSGCTLREPEMGAYFTENLQDVTQLVMNIKT